jgi:hypothetical protein
MGGGATRSCGGRGKTSGSSGGISTGLGRTSSSGGVSTGPGGTSSPGGEGRGSRGTSSGGDATGGSVGSGGSGDPTKTPSGRNAVRLGAAQATGTTRPLRTKRRRSSSTPSPGAVRARPCASSATTGPHSVSWLHHPGGGAWPARPPPSICPPSPLCVLSAHLAVTGRMLIMTLAAFPARKIADRTTEAGWNAGGTSPATRVADLSRRRSRRRPRQRPSGSNRRLWSAWRGRTVPGPADLERCMAQAGAAGRARRDHWPSAGCHQR